MDPINFSDAVACEARADHLEAMVAAADTANDRQRAASSDTRKALFATLVGKFFLIKDGSESMLLRIYAGGDGKTRCTRTTLSESDILWPSLALNIEDSERIPLDNVRAMFPNVSERLLAAMGLWCADDLVDGLVLSEVREIAEVEYGGLRTEMIARASAVAFPPPTTQTHVLTGRAYLLDSGV